MPRKRRGTPPRRDDTPEPDQILLDLVNGLRDVTERVSALEYRFDALGTAAADPEGSAAAVLGLELRGSAGSSSCLQGLPSRW